MGFLRLKKAKSGISTIIGGVIVIAIMFTVITPLFFYMNTVTNLYDTIAAEMRDLDQQRTWEEMSVYAWEMYAGVERRVDISIINKGTMAVDITRIWVVPESTPPSLGYFPYNLLVKPGDSILINDENINQFIQTEIGNAPFYIKIMTTRGNMFSSSFARPPPGVEGEGAIYKQIGYISVEFKVRGFLYTSTSYPDTQQPAWIIDKDDGQEVIFWIEFVNHHDYPIKLLSHSKVEMVYYEQGSINSEEWFIVDDASSVGDLRRYDELADPIWLYNNPDGDYLTGGPPVVVSFGSSKCAIKDDGTPENPDKQSLQQTGDFQIFVMLYYEYEDLQYGMYPIGQVIPFASITVTK